MLVLLASVKILTYSIDSTTHCRIRKGFGRIFRIDKCFIEASRKFSINFSSKRNGNKYCSKTSAITKTVLIRLFKSLEKCRSCDTIHSILIGENEQKHQQSKGIFCVARNTELLTCMSVYKNDQNQYFVTFSTPPPTPDQYSSVWPPKR